MSTQLIKCKICDTEVAVLKTTTYKIKPLVPDVPEFQLGDIDRETGEPLGIICPGCGVENKIR